MISEITMEGFMLGFLVTIAIVIFCVIFAVLKTRWDEKRWWKNHLKETEKNMGQSFFDALDETDPEWEKRLSKRGRTKVGRRRTRRPSGSFGDEGLGIIATLSSGFGSDGGCGGDSGGDCGGDCGGGD